MVCRGGHRVSRGIRNSLRIPAVGMQEGIGMHLQTVHLLLHCRMQWGVIVMVPTLQVIKFY